MEFYTELIDKQSGKSYGYAKVLYANHQDPDKSVVTLNGVNEMELGTALATINPIQISDAILTKCGFIKQKTSNFLYPVAATETVYHKSFLTGWSLEVLTDGAVFYYLKPNSSNLNGCDKVKVESIEVLQSEVLASENKVFRLPLLSTIINKTRLHSELNNRLMSSYMSYYGPFSSFINNNKNTPDYASLTYTPIDANTHPITIEITDIKANSATIVFRIGLEVIKYASGMDFQSIIISNPGASKISAQMAGMVKQYITIIDEAIALSLQC